MQINNQVVSDPTSGLVIKFENGRITIWGDPLPSELKLRNRDFFFNEDGTFDGTGTGCDRCPINNDKD
jgi:hypothetical protein